MNRILFLDIAKAICIILVVIGHFYPEYAPNWYNEIHDIIYTFHMPLFMFASGFIYIATRKDTPYKSFIIKKIKRLILPYLTTSFIVITLKLISQNNLKVEDPVSITSYLKIFYTNEAAAFFWFIWALWWMFLLIPFFKTKKSHYFLFLISIILHFIPIEFPHYFCLPSFKNMFIYFMFGIISFYISQNEKLCKYLSRLKYPSILLFIFFEYIYIIKDMKELQYIGIILPFLGIIFIIAISKLLSQFIHNKNNILILISYSSYIIYLFHTTFQGFAKALFYKLPLDQSLMSVFVLEAVIAISLGVLGPIMIYKILKKYNITRLLFGL